MVWFLTPIQTDPAATLEIRHEIERYIGMKSAWN